MSPAQEPVSLTIAPREEGSSQVAINLRPHKVDASTQGLGHDYGTQVPSYPGALGPEQQTAGLDVTTSTQPVVRHTDAAESFVPLNKDFDWRVEDPTSIIGSNEPTDLVGEGPSTYLSSWVSQLPGPTWAWNMGITLGINHFIVRPYVIPAVNNGLDWVGGRFNRVPFEPSVQTPAETPSDGDCLNQVIKSTKNDVYESSELEPLHDAIKEKIGNDLNLFNLSLPLGYLQFGVGFLGVGVIAFGAYHIGKGKGKDKKRGFRIK